MENSSKVLIAEDDYASMELLKSKLEEHDREYITVADGLSAIKSIEDNPDVNLVFMDIRLPEVDGIEAMKKIKELRQNIIVIAQTAYICSVEHEKQIYLSSGFDGFIEKPFNLEMLSNIIKKYS